MTCVICKTGSTASGNTTIHLRKNDVDILVKNVPAEICDTCGEAYLSDEQSQHLLSMSEASLRQGAEVEILHYAKAI